MKQTITTSRALSMFAKTFNGQDNFMTPNFVSMHTRGNLAIELSAGDGIFTPELFGVTVLRDTGTGIEREHDLSESFPTKAEAMEYIEGLN